MNSLIFAIAMLQAFWICDPSSHDIHKDMRPLFELITYAVHPPTGNLREPFPDARFNNYL